VLARLTGGFPGGLDFMGYQHGLLTGDGRYDAASGFAGIGDSAIE
jgi:hypothetical protein